MTLVALSPQHISTVLKLVPNVPTLKVIVAMAELSTESKQIYHAWGEQVGIKIIDINECKCP
jgi:long-chain acyl-CoA synthetase